MNNGMARKLIRAIRLALQISGVALISWLMVYLSGSSLLPLYYESFTTDWFRVWRANRVAEVRGPSLDVVRVTVEEQLLDRLPYRSPLDRCILALAVESILDFNPKAVGIDYLLDKHTEPKKDRRIHELFTKHPERHKLIAITRPTESVSPNSQVLERLLVPEQMRASAVLIKDPDHVVRIGAFKDSGVDTLAARLAVLYRGEELTDAQMAAAQPGDNGEFQIDWLSRKSGRDEAIPRLPIEFFLTKAVNTECANIAIGELPESAATQLRPLIEGKIVIIGANLEREDRHLTPFDAFSDGYPRMTGEEIHAQITQQLLDERGIRNVSVPVAMLLVCLVFFISHGIKSYVKKPGAKAGDLKTKVCELAGLLAVLVFGFVTEFLFIYYGGRVIPMGLITEAVGLMFVVGIVAELANRWVTKISEWAKKIAERIGFS